MTLHVDEVHSQVVPSSPGGAATDTEPAPPWEHEERWREARDRLTWLAARVCAEGFDD